MSPRYELPVVAAWRKNAPSNPMLEAAIEAHPAVRSSAVIGLPDDDLGHRVHAIVESAEPLALEFFVDQSGIQQPGNRTNQAVGRCCVAARSAVVALLGGFQSFPMTLVGGLIIGVGESMATLYGTDITDYEVAVATELWINDQLYSDLDLAGGALHHGVRSGVGIGCRVGPVTGYPHPNQPYYNRIGHGMALQVSGGARIGGYGHENYRPYIIADKAGNFPADSAWLSAHAPGVNSTR